MIEYLTGRGNPPLDSAWWPTGGWWLIYGSPLVHEDEPYSEDEATRDLAPQPELRFHEVTTSERGSRQAGIRSPTASC